MTTNVNFSPNVPRFSTRRSGVPAALHPSPCLYRCRSGAPSPRPLRGRSGLTTADWLAGMSGELVDLDDQPMGPSSSYYIANLVMPPRWHPGDEVANPITVPPWLEGGTIVIDVL